MEWEKVNDTTERLKVQNGWLVHRKDVVRCGSRNGGNLGVVIKQHKYDDDKYTYQIQSSMCYVPDQHHKWELDQDGM